VACGSYSFETRAKRGLNKAALQKLFGLAADQDAPLFGVVSRLAWQKGIDLILANLDLIEQIGGQLAVLGSGEASLEELSVPPRKRGRVACLP